MGRGQKGRACSLFVAFAIGVPRAAVVRLAHPRAATHGLALVLDRPLPVPTVRDRKARPRRCGARPCCILGHGPKAGTVVRYRLGPALAIRDGIGAGRKGDQGEGNSADHL